MEGGRRSGDPSSGYVVKNRSSSGCLIVRKKGSDGAVRGVVGSSSSHKVLDSRKEKKKKRHRIVFGEDSASSDDLLLPPQRRLGQETIRVCNGLSDFDKGVVDGSGSGRKRSRGEDIRHNEVVGVISRSGEDLSDRKRNKLDVFDFDEYDGDDGEIMGRNHFDDDGGMEERRFFGSMRARRSGIERQYESGSSRHVIDRRKQVCFERMGGLGLGDRAERDGARKHMSFFRDNYDSDEPIRVQGKNGVLKVMVKKKNKVPGNLNNYDCLEAEGSRKALRVEDTVKKNIPVLPYYSESKSVEKVNSLAGKEKKQTIISKPLSTKNGKVSRGSEDSDTMLKLGSKNVVGRNSMKTPESTKNNKGRDLDSEDSDTSLKLGSRSGEARQSIKGASSGGEKTPPNQPAQARINEVKVKRGTGTEKQKLRERIRGMLLDAGWTIDYRPRRNRDYLDAVYINPSGTAYWSIIKAYDALLKQLNDEEEEAKSNGDPFMPLSDEVLSQLTRKTRKKMEKEMKKKQREAIDARETTRRKSSSIRHDEESMDSGSHGEKLSSFIKQGGKSLKSKMNGDGCFSVNTKGQNLIHDLHDSIDVPTSGSNSHQGRKSRKLGRCTLLVRNSTEGLSSESDGFVPYTGKRTVLSWLIDCGIVQSTQKVRYMNRRRTKVMLEGWITGDGIHCGCCSKILTVSKFEIHAGSKLRQPFQNIYLDSGVSLLESQIDAWNRQEMIEHVAFHTVDTDGDDPNDDTCGLCGDGGDLICCDGCPSTFHQSCLDIEMLPPGDWHCPNCTCKFCGGAKNVVQGDDIIIATLLTCSMCMKKYHKSCIQEMDALSVDADISVPCFCGRKCKELFEQLQKYLGVKHELEAGFSWSLIHRTDANSETSLQGLPQRVECNSKLAVALSVMDECFLPIVDRRSGINLIQNVLYNSESNFNRLNYCGFYTIILERGDEIISAASIRFHGTRLAEMPFIGTRHIYRRQGMCRRLFGAIESVLSSLNVEKLIIPAISELMHTWTEVFGFTNLDELLKHELKSINMLVFPGVDMLQKQLLGRETNKEKKTLQTGENVMELKGSECITIERENKSGSSDSSAGHDLHQCDITGLESARETNEVAMSRSDTHSPGVCLNASSPMSSSLDSSHEAKSLLSLEETMKGKFETGFKEDECALATKSAELNNDVEKTEDKAECSPGEDNALSPIECNMAAVVPDSKFPGVSADNTSHDHEDPVLLEGSTSDDSESAKKLQSASGREALTFAGSNCDKQEENGPHLGSHVEGNAKACKVSDIGNAQAVNLNGYAADEFETLISVEDMKCTDYQSEDKVADEACEGKCPANS